MTQYLIGLCIVIACIFAGYSIYTLKHGAPFVPTSRKKVKKMIELATLTTQDTLLDLGSGDGRIVFASAPYVREAIGVEINPVLCYGAKLYGWIFRKKNVTFLAKNFWHISLHDIDVLMMFCIVSEMPKVQEKIIQEMKPGSRIVSNIFSFKGWTPAKESNGVKLYIVPQTKLVDRKA